ncbi:HBS1-like protein isoform X3 [Varroa destructor]|uniref:Tr-type G domain-containing protein n=1 Tax=Varroa destructor TaxID=109461 RepID=A0A7M7JZZ8_VARDE|nr:HBS1-like protein isoform X3 [Varroa destructor]
MTKICRFLPSPTLFITEIDDYSSDDYGTSFENGCVTPETESLYTYSRERLQSVSKIWEPHNPPVKEEDEDEMATHPHDDDVIDTSQVTEADREKFFDCLDKMRSVVGDSEPENVLCQAAKSQNFDPERALDIIFSRRSGRDKPDVPAAIHGAFKAGVAEAGVKKLFFPETKPLKQHRAPLISVPPVEVPMRVTFSGKNFKELSSKASKFQPGKEAARELNELKIEQEINNAPKKLPPDTPKVTSSPKPARHLKVDTKIIQEQYDKERSARKPLLNLVVIGHVDAGKSTLMGHLLYLTGNVSKKTMDKYEHESKKFGKASFAFAWVLDETPEERSRGITMDIAHARLETGHRIVNILDAPGHKEFIPNMITGAAQADAGILVVNATRGEFETGFESGGQTREHTMLIRSLGVSQLAVVVNKLETCAWSENRFNEIASALRPFFKQTGFGEQSVSYVPCSGLTGDNLHERSKNSLLTAWYKGPCLLEVIDHMRPPARAVTRPLRMCVTDVFKGVQSGVCVAGRIESGSVAQGDKLSVMPAQENCIVKALAIDELSQQRVFAGDNVVVTLDKCDPANIVSGSVLCDLSNLIRVVTKFEAKVVIFNVDVPIIKGFPVILHFQATSEQAHFGRLIKELNRGTGEVIREKPRYLGKNSTGVVIIKVARPVCLELYQDSKELGRITLRQRGQTIAAGIVTALL